MPCSMSESDNPPRLSFFRSSFVARFMHWEKTEAGLGGKLGPEAAALRIRRQLGWRGVAGGGSTTLSGSRHCPCYVRCHGGPGSAAISANAGHA